MGSVDPPAMMTTWMPTKQAWSDLSFTSSKTENNIDYRFITPNRSAKLVPRAQLYYTQQTMAQQNRCPEPRNKL